MSLSKRYFISLLLCSIGIGYFVLVPLILPSETLQALPLPVINDPRYPIRQEAFGSRTCTSNLVTITVNGPFTETANFQNFVMVGSFQVVQIPCAVNVQCGPMYILAGNDGNTYQLIFNSGLNLPQVGQHVEITGIIQNTMAKCTLNGQQVQCQPIGLVTVESWRQA
jgi:hypothetical protein